MRTKPPKPTKWTEDRVLRELTSMLDNIQNKTDVYFIASLFRDKSYTRQRWAEWTQKFKNPLTQTEFISEENIKPKDFVSDTMQKKIDGRNGKRARITDTIRKIEELILTNLVDAGLKDKVNAGLTKHLLQTKHGFTIPQVVHNKDITSREEAIRQAEAEKQRLDRERADEYDPEVGEDG